MTYIIIQVVACVTISVISLYDKCVYNVYTRIKKFTNLVNFIFLYSYFIIMIVLTFMLLVCGYCNVTDKNCKFFDKLMFIVYILLFIWSALWF